MGVYTRFKKSSDGLRKIVELLESTPMSRRQRMIDVGMEEDPEYTKKALEYVLNFNDILGLPDLEFAEVLAETPPKFVGLAAYKTSDDTKSRILSKSQPRAAAEVKETFELPNISNIQIGGGQMKMIETARKLERKGILKVKKIPT